MSAQHACDIAFCLVIRLHVRPLVQGLLFFLFVYAITCLEIYFEYFTILGMITMRSL